MIGVSDGKGCPHSHGAAAAPQAVPAGQDAEDAPAAPAAAATGSGSRRCQHFMGVGGESDPQCPWGSIPRPVHLNDKYSYIALKLKGT